MANSIEGWQILSEDGRFSMRRTLPGAFLDNSKTGPSIPSTEVVDMFGRLFGTILATLFKTNSPKLGELFSQPVDESRCAKQTSDSNSGDSPSSHSEKGNDLSELRSELLKLKRQLSQSSNSTKIDWFSPIRDQHKVESHVIPFHSKPRADGLISFLGRMCQQNPHDQNISSATGTPYDGQSCHQPRNVTELESDSYFYSNNSKDQFVSWDFKNMRVAVTHYFLHSNGDRVNGPHLRSWVIEVSEDGSNWREIDRRENYEGLNGSNRSDVFEVRSIVETRFIRIRMIGQNWRGNQCLYFRAFELFGGLRIPDLMKLT
jgi:hypothetical protein